jgi:predicted RNA-binding protein with PUA-like domain
MHWLLKSEPDSYGWDDLVRDGGTEWDGVRNHAAAGHLKRMSVGELVLVYHSGKAKAAVGIARTPASRRPTVIRRTIGCPSGSSPSSPCPAPSRSRR